MEYTLPKNNSPRTPEYRGTVHTKQDASLLMLKKSIKLHNENRKALVKRVEAHGFKYDMNTLRVRLKARGPRFPSGAPHTLDKHATHWDVYVG